MLKIVAHRGNWTAGVPQNSPISAIKGLEGGCAIEIDLRFDYKKKQIVLSHDELDSYPFVFEDLIQQLPENSGDMIFFHIKDNHEQILRNLLVNDQFIFTDFNFCFFGFESDFKMQAKFAKEFGWDKIAHEVEKGNFGSVAEALESKARYIWLAEISEEFTEEEYSLLRMSGKFIYQVAPDVTGFPKPHNVTNFIWKIEYLDGVCTNVPSYYLDFAGRKR